jgi:hypothetical protein
VSERISDVKRGDRFVWKGVSIEVMRAAKDGSWADIYCREMGTSWTKRQRLPLPEGTERVT